MASWNAVAWTPEQDAAIRQVYERREHGGNKRLAARFGVHPGLVSARAARLGCPPLICHVGPKERPQAYRAEEIALIRAHLGEPIVQIRARLYRKGYSRSLSAVAGVISRHRQRGEWPAIGAIIEERDQLTMQEVCAGLGLNEWQVDRWIKRGLLKSLRVTAAPLLAFRRRDLRAFLITYPGHWDHRFADRLFLLDILCGDEAVMASSRKALEAA